MPPIRLAGCRETQAWTNAKTIQIDVFIIFLICYIDKSPVGFESLQSHNFIVTNICRKLRSVRIGAYSFGPQFS